MGDLPNRLRERFGPTERPPHLDDNCDVCDAYAAAGEIERLRIELAEATEHIDSLHKVVDGLHDSYEAELAEARAENERHVTLLRRWCDSRHFAPDFALRRETIALLSSAGPHE